MRIGRAVARPFESVYLCHPCGAGARQVHEQGVENHEYTTARKVCSRRGERPLLRGTSLINLCQHGGGSRGKIHWRDDYRSRTPLFLRLLRWGRRSRRQRGRCAHRHCGPSHSSHFPLEIPKVRHKLCYWERRNGYLFPKRDAARSAVTPFTQPGFWRLRSGRRRPAPAGRRR